MEPGTIAAVPPNGYFDIQNFSSKSLEWLFFINSEEAPNMKHIGNSPVGEAHISPTIRVDGLDEETKTVYEFYGCFYHACPRCYPNRFQIHPFFGIIYDEVFKRTQQREEDIRSLDFNLKCMWECDWNNMKEAEPDLQQFVENNIHKFSPMDPFKAFSGGRVETFKMLINDERRLLYVDINSLYPFVNSTCKYPKGHPEIILHNFGDFETICERYFGFIYCKILAPQDLHIPVLPGKYGVDNKLIFSLCRLCATSDPRQCSLCEHLDEDRCLTGTWFSEELQLALEKGYKIQTVYGVYHFKEVTTTLFSEYVKSFYKIKLLNSGVPNLSEEELQQFLSEVKERDGIDLSGEQFCDNPSLRNISKLCLNSLWGKFGTRRMLNESFFCSSTAEIRDIFNNENNIVTDIIEMNPNIALTITKKKKLEYLEMNNVANIYIAACTTAHARIILYKYLEKLGERVVYCDTDSIIYEFEEGNNIPSSNFLGEMKNELDADDYITHFVSGGPKNYAFITKKSVVTVKIKGFTIHVLNATEITFENLKTLVIKYSEEMDDLENEDDDVPRKQLKHSTEIYKTHEEHKNEAAIKFMENIRMKQHNAYSTERYIATLNVNKIGISKDWKVTSRIEQKLLTCNYNKRIILSDFSTRPFGFRK
jgi:hypothetical protein